MVLTARKLKGQFTHSLLSSFSPSPPTCASCLQWYDAIIGANCKAAEPPRGVAFNHLWDTFNVYR